MALPISPAPISPAPPASSGQSPAPESAPVGPVAAWVQQLARTVKTCRLYEGENPMVARFRAELTVGLVQLLEREGPLTLEFTSNDVLYGETSVYPARSREDNLAQPFHRDGIRSITFQPGIEPAEVESFLNQLQRASGMLSADQDLVALLWEANLAHVDIDYLPAESDIDGGEGQAANPHPIPWPKPNPQAEADAPRQQDGKTAEDRSFGRSDDWQTGEESIDLDGAFVQLEQRAAADLDRFQREFKAELGETIVQSALYAISDGLASQPNPEERIELGQFLPRVLREAVRTADWVNAREALSLLRSCDLPDWSVLNLVRELLNPPGTDTPLCVAALDKQATNEAEPFLAFARDLGPDGTEWLMTVLAQSQQNAVRRPLARIIGDHGRDHPEQLKPWLSHQDWSVVRFVVQIVGRIGGEKAIGLIREMVDHPEPRVRQEVVAALGQMERAVARPILLKMLAGATGDLFGAILHQLSQGGRDPLVSRKLLGYVSDPKTADRPAAEKRAVYRALSACGGDEILPALEAELFKGGWLSRSPGSDQQELACCLARMGSPGAQAILQRGARTWRVSIRKACENALAGGCDDD